MKLILVRHGHISNENPERPLSPTGVQQIERLAQWVREHAVTPKEIRHSATARTRQTAEILGRVLSPPSGVNEVEGIGPDDAAETLAEKLTDSNDVMFVSHQPFIARLSEILLERNGIQLATAGILVLQKTARGWSVLYLFAP